MAKEFTNNLKTKKKEHKDTKVKKEKKEKKDKKEKKAKEVKPKVAVKKSEPDSDSSSFMSDAEEKPVKKEKPSASAAAPK